MYTIITGAQSFHLSDLNLPALRRPARVHGGAVHLKIANRYSICHDKGNMDPQGIRKERRGCFLNIRIQEYESLPQMTHKLSIQLIVSHRINIR